jgi:hypothetical protein
MQHHILVIRIVRVIAICLLLFNGMGALYGGYSLIFYPDGSDIQLDPALLAHTPFTDYFILGIILFIANGVLSIVALISLILKHKKYYLHILFQGCILLGWLVIQMLLIRKIDMMHYVMGFTGIGMLVCGFAISRLKSHTITTTK